MTAYTIPEPNINMDKPTQYTGVAIDKTKHYAGVAIDKTKHYAGVAIDKTKHYAGVAIDKTKQMGSYIGQSVQNNPFRSIILLVVIIILIVFFIYKRQCLLVSLVVPDRYNITSQCFTGYYSTEQGKECAAKTDNPCCNDYCMITSSDTEKAVGTVEDITSTVVAGAAAAGVGWLTGSFIGPIVTFLFGEGLIDIFETTGDTMCAGKPKFPTMRPLLPDGKKPKKPSHLKWIIPVILGILFGAIFLISYMKFLGFDLTMLFGTLVIMFTGGYLGTIITANLLTTPRPDTINPNGNHYCFAGEMPPGSGQCNARAEGEISEKMQYGDKVSVKYGACCPGFIPSSYISELIDAENAPNFKAWAKASWDLFTEDVSEETGLNQLKARNTCFKIPNMTTDQVKLHDIPPDIQKQFGQKIKPVQITIPDESYDGITKKIEDKKSFYTRLVNDADYDVKDSIDALKQIHSGTKPVPPVDPSKQTDETTDRYCYGDGKTKVELNDIMKAFTGYLDPNTGYLIPTPTNPCCKGNVFYQPAGIKYYMHLMKKGLTGVLAGPFMTILLTLLLAVVAPWALIIEAGIVGTHMVEDAIHHKKVTIPGYNEMSHAKEAFQAAEIDYCIPVNQVGDYDEEKGCYTGKLKEQKYGATASNYPDLDNKNNLSYPCCPGMYMKKPSTWATLFNTSSNESTCTAINTKVTNFKYDEPNDEYCFTEGSIDPRFGKFATNGNKPKALPVSTEQINPCCDGTVYFEHSGPGWNECAGPNTEGWGNFDFTNKCWSGDIVIGAPNSTRKCCAGQTMCKYAGGDDYCRKGGCDVGRDIEATVGAAEDYAKDIGHGAVDAAKDAWHFVSKF